MNRVSAWTSAMTRAVAMCAALLAFAVPSAHADGFSVWKDCADDGTVNQKHSASDYSDALSNPPADAAEYSDCLDQIRAAQLGGSSSGGGKKTTASGSSAGGGDTADAGGGSSSVAPDELQDALTERGIDPKAINDPGAAAPPVSIDGQSPNLAAGTVPSLSGVLALPLPLAVAAIVVLLSAALPLARHLNARFGSHPDGPTPEA